MCTPAPSGYVLHTTPSSQHSGRQLLFRLLILTPVMQACFPGAYRAVCVHLRLHHLAVCAVARADQLALLEGVAAAGEAASEGPAFAVLRSLVLAWLQDASQYSSRYRTLLSH